LLKLDKNMKKYILAVGMSLLTLTNCTNLDEGVYEKKVADKFYATPEGVNAALADLYGEVRGDWNGKGIAGADRGWFDLNEVTTDELMLPTRADGAWDDNGVWRQLYRHEFGPAQEMINNTWNWLYRAVFKSNLAVSVLTAAGADPVRISEAKVLRAYFYYMLMDGWGDIPFYTENNVTIEKIPQASRKTVYEFVVKELTENIDKLPTTKGGEYYGRFNQYAGYALLAKVQLNAQVYAGVAKNTEAAAACDKVMAGGFGLVTDYMTLGGDRCPDQEVILAVFVDADKAPRNIIGIRSLAGAHGEALFKFGTWNGATAHQNFVNKYEANDKRKAQWITGAYPGGVNYVLNISSLTSAGVFEGARNVKYLPVAPYNGGSSSNDFPVFRYADVLLMKAEALLRGGNAAGALPLVNQVRARAGVSAMTSVTLDDIYDERGRELCWEGHRRQDMIRFDKFTLAHDFKPASNAKYKLFPIPAPALVTNATLKQNAGF
jgi:hypothetical protein